MKAVHYIGLYLCYIFEHLVIEDTEKHYCETDLTVSRLALLGARILSDRGGVRKLRVIADGVEHTFSSNVMTQGDHGYYTSALEADPGPFAMMEHLDAWKPTALIHWKWQRSRAEPQWKPRRPGAGGGIVPHHRRVSRIPLSGECVFGADKRQLSCKAVAALAVAFYVFPGDADTKTRGQQMLPPVLGLGDHSKV